jgi:hydroxyethylthiazole kinase-like uncharacterized protein yjeF
MASPGPELTPAAMREADRRCIEDLGIPGAVLMNNAGTAVFGHVKQSPVGIVCGKGNNGGDGYVVARLALLAGMKTTVVLLASPDDVSGDAKTFLDAYTRLGGDVLVAGSEADATREVAALADCQTVVDAILGTGIKGEVRGRARAAIDAWPNCHTVAVDIPSGLDGETGEPCGCAIRANVTVTLQYAKTGLVQSAAKAYVGELVVADIGIPSMCADDNAWAALKAKW